VTVHYPDLGDYLAVAADVTGLDVKVLVTSTKLNLADSALHAPAASFGDEEFYPDFCDKAGQRRYTRRSTRPSISLTVAS
jgi:hypothetical protein